MMDAITKRDKRLAANQVMREANKKKLADHAANPRPYMLTGAVMNPCGPSSSRLAITIDYDTLRSLMLEYVAESGSEDESLDLERQLPLFFDAQWVSVVVAQQARRATITDSFPRIRGSRGNRKMEQLAYQQPWYVVENGSQVDVHARVFPPNQASREVVVASNLSPEDADVMVKQHNAGHFERLRDLENEARDRQWEIGQLHG